MAMAKANTFQVQPQGSASQSIGEAVGQGLGSGLNSLIESKIADLQQRQGVDKRKKTYKEANLPDWLAELPEDKQTLFLKEFDILPPETQQQVSDALNDMGTPDEDKYNQQQQPDQGYQQPQQGFQQPNQGFQQTQPVTENGSMYSPLIPQELQMNKPAEDYGNKEQRIPGLNSLMNAGNGQSSEPRSKENVQSFPEWGHGTNGQAGPMESSNTTPYEFTDKKGFRFQRKPNPQDQRHQDLLEEKRLNRAENRTTQEQQRFDKYIYPQIKAADEKATAIKEEDRALDRIIDATNSGNVQESLAFVNDLLKEAGVDLQKFYNEDTAEIQKFQNYAFKGGSKTFGGKVSNIEFQALMNSFPGLAQSPEGRVRMAELIKLGHQLDYDRVDIMRDIAERHPNISPTQFDNLVAKKLKPLEDGLAKKFKEFGREKSHSVGSEFDELPKASSLPRGSEIVDSHGRSIFNDNGKDWLPRKGK
jgi:hypothetical protein